jgi:hypothetical protein
MAGFVGPGISSPGSTKPAILLSNFIIWCPQIMHIPLKRVIAYVTIAPVGIISLSVQGSLLK